MFTNEEIRKAMEGLVKQKGEDHRSYGRYADPATGAGACFLGALCEFMGRAVPAEGTPPRLILGKGSVSPEMGSVFGVAQALNDAHFEWKYVLLGVDLALADLKKMKANACPCGCGISEDYYSVVEEVKRRRALDKVNSGFAADVMPAWPSNGIKISGGSISSSLGSITFDVTATTTAFENLQAVLNAQPKQKDHALVA